MKTAVVYYTRFGHTAKVAEAMAESLGAEKRRIEPVKEYGFFGMGFRSAFNVRMKLKPMDLDFSGFDRVVLCTPVWAGRPACPARTFLRDAKLEGRQLAVLFCVAGSEIDRAIEVVRAAAARKHMELVATERVVTKDTTDEQLESEARAFAGKLS